MKKTSFIIAILAISVCGIAQQIEINQPCVVYYMPKVETYLDIEYEKTDAQVGIFYQYSQRYLGVNDVVKENKTSYKIKRISVVTRTVADMERSYTIQAGKAKVGINLTEEGILCGINTSNNLVADKDIKFEPSVITTDHSKIAPLLEEQILSGSVAKMAESTAKQIYHLRESRINILSGEAETLPNDGAAIKVMLDQLQNQEDILCALFIGNKSVTTHHSYYPIDVTSNQQNTVVFRFSSLLGPVATDDLSGAPITMTVKAIKKDYSPNAKGNKVVANAIYYNIPGAADISIYKDEQLMCNSQIVVPQNGISVPLDAAWQNYSITINPNTGLITKIEK